MELTSEQTCTGLRGKTSVRCLPCRACVCKNLIIAAIMLSAELEPCLGSLQLPETSAPTLKLHRVKSRIGLASCTLCQMPPARKAHGQTDFKHPRLRLLGM